MTFGIDNKYRRWYFELVSRPDEGGYTERHHIIPRCLGGGNEAENIVRLSYRKHFLAHWLLTKFTEGRAQRKMLTAMGYMLTIKSQQMRVISSWQYDTAKRAARLAKLGTKMSIEARTKMSDSRRGKVLSESHRTAIGNGNRGRKLSIETREKIAAKHRGYKYSPEARAKMGKHMIGVAVHLGKRRITDGKVVKWFSGEVPPEGWKFGSTKLSIETREKISKAATGRKHTTPRQPMSQEARAKISKSRIENSIKFPRKWINNGINNKSVLINSELPFGWKLGRTPQTAETREKISKAGLGRKLSPESIEKAAAKTRGQKRSSEVKAKMRLAKQGIRWITNGIENKGIYDNNIPDGWRIGRSNCGYKQNMRWITNEITNKGIYDNNIPDGWHLGRTTRRSSPAS